MKLEQRHLTKRSFLYNVYGLMSVNWCSGLSLSSTRIDGVWKDEEKRDQPYFYGTQVFNRTNGEDIQIHHKMEYKVPSNNLREGFNKLIEIAKKEYFNQEMFNAYLEAGFIV